MLDKNLVVSAVVALEGADDVIREPAEDGGGACGW